MPQSIPLPESNLLNSLYYFILRFIKVRVLIYNFMSRSYLIPSHVLSIAHKTNWPFQVLLWFF